MSPNFSRLLRMSFAALDVLVLTIVFFSLMNIFDIESNGSGRRDYLFFGLFAWIAWLASCWVYSIYQARYTASFPVFLKRTVHVYFLFVILCIIFQNAVADIDVSRQFTIFFLTLFSVCIIVNRLAYLFTYLYFRKKDYLVKRILIIGFNPTAVRLATILEQQGGNFQVVGFLEEERNVKQLSHYPILGHPADALQTSHRYEVNEIYSTILPEQDQSIYALMDEADRACIRFKLVPDLTQFVKRPMHINYMSEIPVMTSRTEPLDDLANRIRKRAFDLVVASLAIILVLSWLIPLLGLLIMLSSKGPVFFIQTRSGVNNQPFRCFKFRSMKVNRDANLKQATKGDSRFTWIGKLMRRTNLDEFPQFFNVLMGDMSIVGPRPHMLKHTEEYSRLYDQYMIRQFLKPGITGWAQVHGYRGEISSVDDIRNRVQHDIWYLENWDRWLDIRIMFLTVYNMVKGEENAF